MKSRYHLYPYLEDVKIIIIMNILLIYSSKHILYNKLKHEATCNTCFVLIYRIAWQNTFVISVDWLKKTIRENLFYDDHVYNLRSRTCSITESVSNHGNFTTEICFFYGIFDFSQMFWVTKITGYTH